MKIIYPTKYNLSIQTIDYASLKQKGITTLFFDLDNTLISYKTKKIPVDVLSFLKSIEKDFNIFIITNNKKNRTSKAINNNFIFLSNACKPCKSKVNKFIKKNNIDIKKTCFIGDQILTDIYLSNKFKTSSILINPIDLTSEGIPTKINRYRERKYLKKIKQKDYNNYVKYYESFYEYIWFK